MARPTRTRTAKSKAGERHDSAGWTLSKSEIAKIKRGLATLKLPPDPANAMLRQRVKLNAARRALSKKLAPLMAKGIDAKKAAPLLAKYHRERARILKAKDPAVTRAFATAARMQKRALAARRAAVLSGGVRPGPIESVRVALAPFLIKTRPSSCLRGESYAPGDAWARVYYFEDTDHPRFRSDHESDDEYYSYYYDFEINFFYLWRNDRDTNTTVTVSCTPWFTGICTALADAGIWNGGEIDLHGSASLSPFLWNVPDPEVPESVHTGAPPQEQSHRSFLSLHVTGGNIIVQPLDMASKVFNGGIDLRHRSFGIPARTMAVFRVAFMFTHMDMEDAEAVVDFGTAPAYRIAIPSLDLDVFDTPAVTGGPYGTVVGATRDV